MVKERGEESELLENKGSSPPNNQTVQPSNCSDGIKNFYSSFAKSGSNSNVKPTLVIFEPMQVEGKVIEAQNLF